MLASSRSIRSASRVRNSAFEMPSSSDRRRAASTIGCEKSVLMSLPPRAEAAGGCEAAVANPGGELQDRLARLRVERIHEPFAHPRESSQTLSRSPSQPAAISSQILRLASR